MEVYGVMVVKVLVAAVGAVAAVESGSREKGRTPTGWEKGTVGKGSDFLVIQYYSPSLYFFISPFTGAWVGPIAVC